MGEEKSGKRKEEKLEDKRENRKERRVRGKGEVERENGEEERENGDEEWVSTDVKEEREKIGVGKKRERDIKKQGERWKGTRKVSRER